MTRAPLKRVAAVDQPVRHKCIEHVIFAANLRKSKTGLTGDHRGDRDGCHENLCFLCLLLFNFFGCPAEAERPGRVSSVASFFCSSFWPSCCWR